MNFEKLFLRDSLRYKMKQYCPNFILIAFNLVMINTYIIYNMNLTIVFNTGHTEYLLQIVKKKQIYKYTYSPED